MTALDKSGFRQAEEELGTWCLRCNDTGRIRGLATWEKRTVAYDLPCFACVPLETPRRTRSKRAKR